MIKHILALEARYLEVSPFRHLKAAHLSHHSLLRVDFSQFQNVYFRKKCCIYYAFFQSNEEAYTGGVVFPEAVLNHSEILLKVIMLCQIIWTRKEEKPAGQNSRISIQINTNTFQFPNEDDCAPIWEYLPKISRDSEISWCLYVCFWNPCPMYPCYWSTTRKVLHKPVFYIFCMVLRRVYVHQSIASYNSMLTWEKKK